jgi:hypothetical protein
MAAIQIALLIIQLKKIAILETTIKIYILHQSLILPFAMELGSVSMFSLS